ncbi:hypothetical protein QFZ80_004661 [Paenibacillus sp. V4I7]|nr:hypothetical protein [Paenibacillus sp. V4I7]MDQ0920658.1 hypothetical protein [Paenibacillus sp. V4I5]
MRDNKKIAYYLALLVRWLAIFFLFRGNNHCRAKVIIGFEMDFYPQLERGQIPGLYT